MTEVIKLDPNERYLILMPQLDDATQERIAKLFAEWYDDSSNKVGLLFADGTKVVKLSSDTDISITQSGTCRHCAEQIAFTNNRWSHVSGVKHHQAEPKG